MHKILGKWLNLREKARKLRSKINAKEAKMQENRG